MKEKLLAILIRIKTKIIVIIKILLTDVIVEQALSKSTLVLIAPKHENQGLLRFISDKDSVYIAVNSYIKSINDEEKPPKNIITFKVRPKN